MGQAGSALQWSASGFANGTDNNNLQTLARQYLPPQDSLASYDQLATSRTRGGTSASTRASSGRRTRRTR